MRKIQTARQEKILNDIEKTYPIMLLYEKGDLARLMHPNIFPSNESRLFTKLSNNCKIAIGELNFLLNKLPDTYKSQFLSNYDFDIFIDSLLKSNIAVDKKSKSKKQKTKFEQKFQPYSFRVASSMFIKSLEFIIKSLPVPLQDSLKREIFAFLLQLNGFSEFMAEMNPREKLPYLEIPYELYPPERKPPFAILS